MHQRKSIHEAEHFQRMHADSQMGYSYGDGRLVGEGGVDV